MKVIFAQIQMALNVLNGVVLINLFLWNLHPYLFQIVSLNQLLVALKLTSQFCALQYEINLEFFCNDRRMWIFYYDRLCKYLILDFFVILRFLGANSRKRKRELTLLLRSIMVNRTAPFWTCRGFDLEASLCSTEYLSAFR